MEKYPIPSLEDLYYQFITLNKTNEQLSKHYNVSQYVIHTWKRHYKLKKDMDLIRKSFIPKGCFEKGHRAWNKGKKGWFTGSKKNWFSHKTTLEKAKQSFGKPRFQGNWVVCLSEETCYRKNTHNGKMYKHHKTISFSRLVLKQNGIDVPKGYIVYHKDGNYMNNDITNLEVISRAELLKRNRMEAKYAMESL